MWEENSRAENIHAHTLGVTQSLDTGGTDGMSLDTWPIINSFLIMISVDLSCLKMSKLQSRSTFFSFQKDSEGHFVTLKLNINFRRYLFPPRHHTSVINVYSFSRTLSLEKCIQRSLSQALFI